jgi:hypothetical protein
MAKIRTVKTSFVSGELAQQVFGRIDKDFYFKGADKLRNVYVDPLGGVYKREGMRLVDRTYENQNVKLVDFAFNTEQLYLIVFSHQRMRVYKDDVLVADITGQAPLNDITTARLNDLKYTQSSDTLIITHEDIKPIKITRTSHTVWNISYITFDFIPTHAFNGTTVSEPNASLTFSVLLGNNVKLTASTGIFNTSHVNQTITGKTGGIFLIRSYVSPTVVYGDIAIEFPKGTVDTPLPANEWELETGYEPVWNDIKGYPRTCSFYQGRLWFGGSKSRPATLWGSRADLFFDFDVGGAKADDAIDVTIDDDRVNAIVNIFPGRNLQVFTTGGEFFIPQNENDPIKPENIMLQKSTLHGSSKVKPVSVDGSTIFIESSGRVVRQFLFNDSERSYNAQSISLLSSQLIQQPVAMGVRQSRDVSPADYVYFVNSNGTIAVLNILRAEQLLAWSLFETQGVVEDLVVVGRDVYIETKRTINNQEGRLIEKLDRNYYLDAGILASTAQPQYTHTGFQKLANQQVKVRAETFVLNDNTVNTDGTINLELDYKNIEVGLGFEVLIRMLPIDMDLGGKTLTGDWRRLVYALVKVFNSRSFRIRCGNNVFRPVFRSLGSKLLDQQIPLYSGWKKIYLSGGVSRDATFDIIQDEPVDFGLVSCVIAVTI